MRGYFVRNHHGQGSYSVSVFGPDMTPGQTYAGSFALQQNAAALLAAGYVEGPPCPADVREETQSATT